MNGAATTGRSSVLRRRNPRATAALAAIALYVTATVVQLVPGSPWNAVAGDDHIGRSFFGQRWNLFARPPNANLSTHVIVRYRDRTGVHVTPALDLSGAARRASRAAPLAPPRLARVVTKLNVALEAAAYEDGRAALDAGVRRGRPHPVSLAQRIAARRAPTLEIYRRLLSSVAVRAVPDGATVLEVRGVLVRTGVADLEEPPGPAPRVSVDDPGAPVAVVSPDVLRELSGDGARRVSFVFDSGWLRYERDVTTFEVTLR